ncbi:MAG: hypothetical protein ACRDOU_27740 [Streptosporangiaceae bacterium]
MTAAAAWGYRSSMYADRPLLGQARAVAARALHRSGLRAVVEEIEGPYPSPSGLTIGADVTGREPAEAAACRLDLPREAQILAVLNNVQRA